MNKGVDDMRQPKGLPFCCGWWSPWCWIDEALHRLRIPIEWVCTRHDDAITEQWVDGDE